MNVTLTGPDGVLGSNLVRELLSRNYQVKVMTETGKQSPTLENLEIEKIAGNILNSTEVEKAIKGADYVVHCAAITAMWPLRSTITKSVNVEGTRRVIEACIKHKVKRLIYIGSANSFGSGTILKPGSESNPYEGEKYGLDYMDSKLEAQRLVLKAVEENELDAIVINPTFMIGPYDSKPSSGQLILSVYHGKVPGYAAGGKNFVAVKDVVIAVANGLTKGKKGQCYIAGNENLTYKEAFDKISKNTKSKIVQRRISPFAMKVFGKLNSFFAKLFGYYPQITGPLARLASEEHYYSSSKAVSELDMPQTSIDEAIRDCFEWFKTNKYI